MLHLDDLVTRTPRLPVRRFGPLTPLAASVALHVTGFILGALLAFTGPSESHSERGNVQAFDVQHLVFLTPELRQIGGGGGGGGNRQPGPIRRAQAIGQDAVTIPARREPPPAAPVESPSAVPIEQLPEIPRIVLDAKALASGTFEQVGLPTGGVSSGTSTGSGSGGGVGTGTGSGIGPGRGRGVGPGSGGGIGGGVYRAGGAVTAPRVITEVKPSYTSDALLRRIQGTVILEVVVTRDGCTSQIRVIRSLDPGLDREAIVATAQWRFEPGRLAGTPVDVLVNVVLDFWIR